MFLQSLVPTDQLLDSFRGEDWKVKTTESKWRQKLTWPFGSDELKKQIEINTVTDNEYGVKIMWYFPGCYVDNECIDRW